MEQVTDKHYHIYARVTTFFALLLFLGALSTEFISAVRDIGAMAGFTTFTAMITGLSIVYYFALYRLLFKIKPWLSAFISGLLITLAVFGLIHTTGQLQSPWLLAWALITLANGLFGSFAMVYSGFLITLYYVVLHTQANGTFEFSAIDTAVVGVFYIVSFLGYILWRHAYAAKQTQQVSKLSGLVKSKQTESEILIQSITDGILVVDTARKITSINPAAAKMAGWTAEDALGIDVTQVIRVYEENVKDISTANPQDVFGAVLKTQKQFQATLQLIARSGKQLYVSVIISPVKPDENQPMVGAIAVMRDISATRQEEQRRADFISTASHEMRTPVAAIEGYLALALNDKVTKIDQKARAYLEKAHSSTQHLGKLFQDLLTSAKAEDGRLVSHPVVTEMGSYLEQIADSLRFTAEKKGLLIEFSIGVTSTEKAALSGGKVIKPLYYVHVDPDRMREVITNLFDNAVKYTETGKISIGLTGNNDVAQMYIRDTGPGIAPEDVPHLFQKFYRVDNSSTRTIGGTGLGLFICKKIVELYNGRIWVDSKVGEGSTFYINLPRLSTQKASEMQAQEMKQGVGLPNV